MLDHQQATERAAGAPLSRTPWKIRSRAGKWAALNAQVVIAWMMGACRMPPSKRWDASTEEHRSWNPSSIAVGECSMASQRYGVWKLRSEEKGDVAAG